MLETPATQWALVQTLLRHTVGPGADTLWRHQYGRDTRRTVGHRIVQTLRHTVGMVQTHDLVSIDTLDTLFVS